MTPRHRGWCGVVVAALLACATPSQAQTSALKQGLDAAWARQPEQRGAALRRDAVEAAQQAARRWTPDTPSLELSARTDRFTRNQGAREYDAALALPLWLPGERAGAQALAASEATALRARLQAAQWRLAEQVREAYWAGQRARIEHTLALQRLASARQLADDVARRVRAGDLARADGHQAEGAVAAAQGALAQAEVANAQASRTWAALTGQAQAPAEPGMAEPRPDAASSHDASHPALRELAAQADAARGRQALAQTQSRANPELTLGATRERGGQGERYGQSLVVGLRIPLGTTSASAGKVATAGAERAEAEAQLALEGARLDAQVRAARTALAALDTARASAEQRASLARETRGFFEKSFRLGESDLPTRLRVELEAFEAEREAARSHLEAGAAVSQLRQALGLLPE